jgi:hypothetical protein
MPRCSDTSIEPLLGFEFRLKLDQVLADVSCFQLLYFGDLLYGLQVRLPQPQLAFIELDGFGGEPLGLPIHDEVCHFPVNQVVQFLLRHINSS